MFLIYLITYLVKKMSRKSLDSFLTASLSPQSKELWYLVVVDISAKLFLLIMH